MKYFIITLLLGFFLNVHAQTTYKDDRVEFTQPAGYKLVKGDNERLFKLVLKTPEFDMMAPSIDVTIEDTKGKNLDELVADADAKMKEFTMETGTATLMGETVPYREYAMVLGEKIMKLRTLFIIRKKKLYTIAYAAGTEYYDTYLKDFTTVIGSLEIK